MKRIPLIMLALLASLPTAVLAAHSSPHPKITESHARAIAQARVPKGHVKSHELEHENGRLIYSYEFTVPGKSGVEEVNVDAHSGKVLAVEHESPNKERQEAAQDKKNGATH